MVTSYIYFFEPRHDISKNVVCVTSKGSDQPAQARSLIRALAIRLNMLLTKKHLEVLHLRGGFTGSSEFTLVKMPHRRVSYVLTNDNTVQSVSLAVSVALSILAIYVLLPFSEEVGTFCICANVNIKRPHWKTGVKLFV